MVVITPISRLGGRTISRGGRELRKHAGKACRIVQSSNQHSLQHQQTPDLLIEINLQHLPSTTLLRQENEKQITNSILHNNRTYHRVVYDYARLFCDNLELGC